MDISKTITALRKLEESEGYKEQNPTVLKRKDELDEKISSFIWE